MDFTLCPDHGPRRLIRFSNELPPEILSILDTKDNVVTVNKQVFDLLDRADQQRALTMRVPVIYLSDEGRIELPKAMRQPPPPPDLAA